MNNFLCKSKLLKNPWKEGIGSRVSNVAHIMRNERLTRKTQMEEEIF